MKDDAPKDVILVAHGHLTRAFAKRWLGYEMDFPLSLMMQPGGVGILSYQHSNIDEPALLLGIGFPKQED
jgi:probable phosphoglycerate mutase